MPIVLVVFIRIASERINAKFLFQASNDGKLIVGTAYSATKPIPQRSFSSLGNALKRTYSNVGLNKLSGGDTPGPPLKGRG